MSLRISTPIVLAALLVGCATPLETASPTPFTFSQKTSLPEIKSVMDACRYIMEQYRGVCAGPPAFRTRLILDRTGDKEANAYVVPLPAGYVRMLDVYLAESFDVIVFADGELLPEAVFFRPSQVPAQMQGDAFGEGYALFTRERGSVCFARRPDDKEKLPLVKYCIDEVRFDAARKFASGEKDAAKNQVAFLKMLFMGIEIRWTSFSGSVSVALRHKMFVEKKAEVAVDGRKRTVTFTDAPGDRRSEEQIDIKVSEQGRYELELVFGDDVEHYEIDVKSWSGEDSIAVNSPYETTPRFSCLNWLSSGVVSELACPKHGRLPL